MEYIFFLKKKHNKDVPNIPWVKAVCEEYCGYIETYCTLCME